MNRTAIACTTIISITALAITTLIALGPLNPPSGAVSSSNKTLAELEPRTALTAVNTPGDGSAVYIISQPGSYYLTSNINAPVNRSAIKITATGVRVDLNGFTLSGSGGAAAGITITASAQRVNIANGTITGFGYDGIDGGFNLYGRYERLTVLANGNALGARVGIRAGGNAVLIACTSSSNTGGGISGNDNCVCTQSTATSNTDAGMRFGLAAEVRDCTVASNAAQGFLLGNGSAISSCSANNNAGGFSLGAACTITACSCLNNSTQGIFVTGEGGTISNCSVYGNGGSGIRCLSGALISGCMVEANNPDGIVVSSVCSITGCTVKGHNGNSILAASNNLITNNNCYGTPSPNAVGLAISGNGNRIEGNMLAQNDRGLFVTGTSNIIMRNTCTANSTNWVIAVGNSYGAIVVPTTNGIAVSTSGNATNTLGLPVDPNANYSY